MSKVLKAGTRLFTPEEINLTESRVMMTCFDHDGVGKTLSASSTSDYHLRSFHSEKECPKEIW